MAPRTPRHGQATRIAREGSEDVVPVDPESGTAVKKEPKKKGRPPSRGRVDVPTGNVSEAEQATPRTRGMGKTGKGEGVGKKPSTKTPGRGRTRKNPLPARSKPTEPDEDLQEYEDEDEDEDEDEARHYNPKPITSIRGKDREPVREHERELELDEEEETIYNPKPISSIRGKGREPVREPELDPPLEEDAAGLGNALNQDVVTQTAAAEVKQHRVEAPLAQVQQAISTVSQLANQPERSPSSWIPWAIQFVVLLAIVSGISYFGYAQFLEVSSTIDTRVKAVEQQLQLVMDLEIPTLQPEPRRVDWFSFGLGALPLMNLCTPPYRIPPAPTPPKRTWFWSKTVAAIESPEVQLERKQVERMISPLNASQALLHWDEPSPRYCVRAAGKLQLAVFTPRSITPTELVIEDYHKDEVLRIATAPRDVELWMSTQTPAQRQLLNDQINENHIHIQTIRSRNPALSQDAAQLTADWMPIGRWRYNIYAEDNVQKFPIELEMGDVSSRKFAVRVMNNWGDSNMICLVRARMYGIDRSKVRERLMPERVVTEGRRQAAKVSSEYMV